MVGMVSRGEAHLSTGGIYLDPRRGRAVDFTIPFFYDTLTLHVLRQEGNAVNFNVFLVLWSFMAIPFKMYFTNLYL